MVDGLTFVINPETESASVDLLLKSLEDIRRFLRHVDYAIYGSRSRHQWMVRKLQSSAPSITLEPGPSAAESVDVIGTGLRTVTAGTDRPPPHFTEQVLEDLTKMKRLFGGTSRAKSIAVFMDGEQVATIRQDISEKASRILTAGYRNFGTLEGTLEAINVHRNLTVTVWDRVSGSPVRCSVPKDDTWVARVKSLLERRVSVTGNINYFVNGAPKSVSSVVEIEDATPDPNLPRAEFGSIPDEYAARDPAGFLRSVRGLS